MLTSRRFLRVTSSMLVQSMVVPFSSPQIMRMFLFPGPACCMNAGDADRRADRRIESPMAAAVSGYFLVIISPTPANRVSRGLPNTIYVNGPYASPLTRARSPEYMLDRVGSKNQKRDLAATIRE